MNTNMNYRKPELIDLTSKIIGFGDFTCCDTNGSSATGCQFGSSAEKENCK